MSALLFMLLEGAGVSVSWPTEAFLSGFMVMGVAAWISGRALFAVSHGTAASDVVRDY